MVPLAAKLAEPAKAAFSYDRIKNTIRALKKAHWARDMYLHDGDVPVEKVLNGELPLGEATSPEPTIGTTYLRLRLNDVSHKAKTF